MPVAFFGFDFLFGSRFLGSFGVIAADFGVGVELRFRDISRLFRRCASRRFQLRLFFGNEGDDEASFRVENERRIFLMLFGNFMNADVIALTDGVQTGLALSEQDRLFKFE